MGRALHCTGSERGHQEGLAPHSDPPQQRGTCSAKMLTLDLKIYLKLSEINNTHSSITGRVLTYVSMPAPNSRWKMGTFIQLNPPFYVPAYPCKPYCSDHVLAISQTWGCEPPMSSPTHAQIIFSLVIEGPPCLGVVRRKGPLSQCTSWQG